MQIADIIHTQTKEHPMKRLAILTILAVAMLATTTLHAAKPLKVFILAGQSNMEGQGAIQVPQRNIDNWKNGKYKLTDEQIAAKLSGTLTNLVRNPDKKDRYAHIVDKEGRWIVRDDVWVYYNRGGTGLKKGDLTVGFGANDGKIGPEQPPFPRHPVRSPALSTAFTPKAIS